MTADLVGVDGVQAVHDLYLGTLTSGMNVATAHLVERDVADSHGILAQARDLLRTKHRIDHTTLPVEPADHRGCAEIGWRPDREVGCPACPRRAVSTM